MGANTGELDDCGTAADDRVVANDAMARQHDVVGKDHVVADAAVVAHVTVSEKRARITHRRDGTAAGRAGIHRDAFPDRAIGADGQRARLTLEFQILGLMTDRGERENPRARANLGLARNGDVAQQFTAITQLDVRTDTTKWPDRYIGTNLGTVLDY